MATFSTLDLKRLLRSGPYVWPGGYPIYFVADDGGALSFKAVKENFREVVGAMLRKENNGWRVVGYDTNFEDPDLVCSHTGERIPSAYAED